MPVNLLRFHSPSLSAAFAGATCRAAASIRATASSAAETMLEVGALTTITPLCVAARTSTLSRPTPARAMTLRRRGRGERLGVDLGRAADQDRVHVDDGRQQLGAVRAVAGADLEVRAQRLDGGGAELFGDEYDGLAHRAVLGFGSVARWWPRPLVKPVEGDAVHDVVPVPGLYPIDAPTCRSRRPPRSAAVCRTSGSSRPSTGSTVSTLSTPPRRWWTTSVRRS